MPSSWIIFTIMKASWMGSLMFAFASNPIGIPPLMGLFHVFVR
jgi:hypothetical protein